MRVVAELISEIEKPVVDRFKRESEVRFYSRHVPVVFEAARGARLIGTDGREYLDFFAAAGALNYGHNHPELKAAIAEAMARDAVVTPLDLYTPERADFIAAVEQVILTPRQLDYRIQFPGPTGANAVEAALKLARKASGRTGVVAFTNAFHGCSLGALAVTGNLEKRRAFLPSLNGVTRLPYDGYAGENTLETFAAMLEDPSSGLEVPGAVILEVVQGEGGLRPASEAWLLALQAICGKHGVVLIADEIQCGCGRTGQLLSFDSTSFRPDVICLSKSLSGLGLPLSMLLLRNDLDVWSPGEHSGTFRANNLAVATGARALRFWLDPIFTAQVRRNTIALVDRLAAFEARWPGTKRVGTGLMSGLAISAPGAAERVAKGAFEAGVILETCGPRNEVLKFFPPINIDEDELEHGLNLIGRAIDATIKQSEFVG